MEFHARMLRSIVLALLSTCCVASAAAPPALLVFTRTTGFRHDSIDAGVEAVRRIGDARSVRVDVTEDPAWFNPTVLSSYDAVIFMNTSGNVLEEPHRLALQHYIEGGGGFVGVHAAADSEYDWPWYARLIGARFQDHPPIQEATILVLDRSHPSTAHLPSRWTRTDEWYNFTFSPRGLVHVLATLDTRSFEGSSMRTDHPIVWCRYAGRGRAWYTGLGHTKASYSEPEFIAHLDGGIAWAAGWASDAGLPGQLGLIRPVTVLDDLEDPIALALSRAGDLVVLDRRGIYSLHPASGDAPRIVGDLGRRFEVEDGYTIRFRVDETNPEAPVLRAFLPSIERPGRSDVVVIRLPRDATEPLHPPELERISGLRNVPEVGWFLAFADDSERHEHGFPASLDNTLLRPDPDRRLLVLGWRDEERGLMARERFAADLPWVHPFDVAQGSCGRIFVLDREFPDRSETAFGRIVRLDWIGNDHPAHR